MASTVLGVPGRRPRALACICFQGDKENTGFVWTGGSDSGGFPWRGLWEAPLARSPRL